MKEIRRKVRIKSLYSRDVVYLYIKHTFPENQFIGQGLYKAQVRVSSKRMPLSLLLNVPDGLALLSLEKSSYILIIFTFIQHSGQIQQTTKCW